MQDREVSAQAYHQPSLLGVGSVPGERHSPKRPTLDTAGMADVFPYYAGFSFAWAHEKLAALDGDSGAVVLDPWNGSGTTTLAAQARGLRTIGVDLNPVASIVARLRVNVRHSATLCEAPKGPFPEAPSESDPLCAWLEEGTARRLRHWERMLSGLAATESMLGYVALFRVVRQITRNFEGSNPTWVKRASSLEDLVSMPVSDLDDLIVHEQRSVVAKLTRDRYAESPTQILTASSTALPIANSSVDAILTSPPYLTRIDYAVAYSRELAVLGVDISRDRRLRSDLMGTTLIRGMQLHESAVGGPLARDLMERVSKHSSKASGGYYLKQIKQYIADLTNSFSEATRVAKPGARMILVVQDSYYKDIPIELAAICMEEAELRGWKVVGTEPFEVTRLLTQMNTAARAYPKGNVSETVVYLQKG